ncbi:MAG: hypothetical protein AAF456_20050 [Planctomycetota bacterium]
MQPNYNHPFLNPHRPPTKSMLAKSIRVDLLVEKVIDRNEPMLTNLGIRVATDLTDVEMIAHSGLLERGIEALVHNAANALATGGELSVTLMNSDHQWELEVAETMGSSTHSKEAGVRPDSGDDSVPVILPFPANDNLKTALDIAAHHRGQLQSWQCQGGGNAFVLVVPNRKLNEEE